MKKKLPLSKTNPWLKNKKLAKKLLDINAKSSTAIENE